MNNIVYGNYIPFIHTEDSHQAIRHNYSVNHEKCPKCGGTDNSQTLMGFTLDMSKPEEYKDENHVRCKCGWTGIVHDLV